MICQRSRLSYIYINMYQEMCYMYISEPSAFWPQHFKMNLVFWIRRLQSGVQIQCLTHITVVFRFRGIDAHVLHGKSKSARSWFSDDKVTLQISLWQFVHIFSPLFSDFRQLTPVLTYYFYRITPPKKSWKIGWKKL